MGVIMWVRNGNVRLYIHRCECVFRYTCGCVICISMSMFTFVYHNLICICLTVLDNISVSMTSYVSVRMLYCYGLDMLGAKLWRIHMLRTWCPMWWCWQLIEPIRCEDFWEVIMSLKTLCYNGTNAGFLEWVRSSESRVMKEGHPMRLLPSASNLFLFASQPYCGTDHIL